MLYILVGVHQGSVLNLLLLYRDEQYYQDISN